MNHCLESSQLMCHNSRYRHNILQIKKIQLLVTSRLLSTFLHFCRTLYLFHKYVKSIVLSFRLSTDEHYVPVNLTRNFSQMKKDSWILPCCSSNNLPSHKNPSLTLHGLHVNDPACACPTRLFHNDTYSTFHPSAASIRVPIRFNVFPFTDHRQGVSCFRGK